MQKETSAKKNDFQKSTMKLHQVLRDFKHTENHKSALFHKINILKMHYDANKKKTKNIQSSIMRINQVKQYFSRQKDEIEYILNLQKEKHNRKIAREKQKRQNSKQNIQIIKNMITEEKQHQYKKLKEKQRINQLKIRQHFKKSLHQKRQKSLQVKLHQEESRLTKTIFFETKRLRAQKDSQNEIAPLEFGLSMNQKYLTQMRQIQKEMIQKLNNSRDCLSKSKLTFRKILNQTSY